MQAHWPHVIIVTYITQCHGHCAYTKFRAESGKEDLPMKVTEGYMPFLEYKTYYRIVGECTGNKKPLLLLHGGPGSAHNYFEVMDSLAEEGRAVIMYDQIGCGLSATPSRPDLWNQETWIDELIALRKHLGLDEVHLLGQSWGGMQAIAYLCDYAPEGVTSVILSSTLPAAEMWAKEQHRMIGHMTKDQQEAIRRAEETGNFDDPEYLAANDVFMQLHCAGPVGENDPECLRRKKVSGTEAYVTGWGPNEYNPTGTLGNFEYRDKIGNIKVPTLITSGLEDLCTPWIAKYMNDAIPGSKWELFEFSRHMPFVDENEKYLKILSAWMRDHD